MNAARRTASGCPFDDHGWPVREHGIVTDTANGREYLVLTASYMRHEVVPEIDYVRCEAGEHKTYGTEPGGPQLAAR